MSITGNKEYKILLTHAPLHQPDSQQHWQAIALDFPHIVEEAASRDAVIQQIKSRIDDITRHAEVIVLTAPDLSQAAESRPNALVTQGWDDHGLFRDDPEALRLFDAIEEERDRHRVGDV